ncbi:MAG: ABC transporter permease subunit [Firmicutes bacterium]|nr:ABC transporter permease subunit [Bacillota bacterium]
MAATVPRRRAGAALAGAYALLVTAAALLPLWPLLSHLPWRLLGGALTGSPYVRISLESGALALALVVALGLPTAYYLARLAPPRLGRGLLLALFVPLLMPPLVLGLLLAYLFGPYAALGTALGRVGLPVANALPGLVIAQIYEALPYFILTAWSAFAAVPADLDGVWGTWGMPPGARFRRVTLPLALPGLLVAVAMAWARITGAFGAVMVLAYHPTGLPVGIWVTLEEAGLPAALPLAFWLLVIGLPVPLGLEAWRRRLPPGP